MVCEQNFARYMLPSAVSKQQSVTVVTVRRTALGHNIINSRGYIRCKSGKSVMLELTLHSMFNIPVLRNLNLKYNVSLLKFNDSLRQSLWRSLSGFSALQLSFSRLFNSQFFCSYFMATLWNRAGHYIFILLSSDFFFLLFLFSSPILSRRRLDVYHTSTHDVALVRI